MEPEKPVQYPAGYNASEWTCCDFDERLATHVTHALRNSHWPSRSAGQQPGFRPRIFLCRVPNTSRSRTRRRYALSVNTRCEIDKETLRVGKRVIFRELERLRIESQVPNGYRLPWIVVSGWPSLSPGQDSKTWMFGKPTIRTTKSAVAHSYYYNRQ